MSPYTPPQKSVLPRTPAYTTTADILAVIRWDHCELCTERTTPGPPGDPARLWHDYPNSLAGSHQLTALAAHIGETYEQENP